MQEVGTLGCPSFTSFHVINTRTLGTPACQTLYLHCGFWAEQDRHSPCLPRAYFLVGRQGGGGISFTTMYLIAINTRCDKYQDVLPRSTWNSECLGGRYPGRLPREKNISVEIWKEKMNYVKEGRRILGRKDSKCWVPEVERSVLGCKGSLMLDECKKTGGEKMPDHAEEAGSQITQVI